MTVTFQVPTNSALPAKAAARVFTTTGEIAYACVRFPNSLRPVEVVWMKQGPEGTAGFVYPYSIASTKVGNVYTVVRQQGWPKDLELHVEPVAQSGGDLFVDPAAEAWYVLDPVRRTVDQTGHGHTLTGSGTNVAGPKLGMVAQTSLGLAEATPSAVWRTGGALSVVALANIAGSSGDRWFASCEISGGYNTWWKFGLSSNGKPFYGVNRPGESQAVEWGPVLPTSGWHTFGFVREADGLTLRAYLDGELVASSAAPFVGAGGASAVITVGKDFFAAVQAYHQQCTGLYLTALSASAMAAIGDRFQGTTA
jgi:hypothetical protein